MPNFKCNFFNISSFRIGLIDQMQFILTGCCREYREHPHCGIAVEGGNFLRSLHEAAPSSLQDSLEESPSCWIHLRLLSVHHLLCLCHSFCVWCLSHWRKWDDLLRSIFVSNLHSLLFIYLFCFLLLFWFILRGEGERAISSFV